MRFVPFVLALALLGGATAAGAGASPASPAKAGSLCSVGKSVALTLQKTSKGFTPTAGSSPQAYGQQLKVYFTRIKSAESVVLSAASGSIKGHLQKVFAFYNTIIAKFQAANWNILAFAKSAASLEAGEQKIKPDVTAINAYFKKCK